MPSARTLDPLCTPGTRLGLIRTAAILALAVALAGAMTGCFDLRTDGVEWACGSDDDCGSGFTCLGGTCRDIGTGDTTSACMAYVNALEACYAQRGIPLDTSTLIDTCEVPSADDALSRDGFACQAELLEETDCAEGVVIDFSICW